MYLGALRNSRVLGTLKKSGGVLCSSLEEDLGVLEAWVRSRGLFGLWEGPGLHGGQGFRHSLAFLGGVFGLISATVEFSLQRGYLSSRFTLHPPPPPCLDSCLGLPPEFPPTLKSCTPMQANMNCRSVVTIMIFPMVRMATNTHCTTCCRHPQIWLMDTAGHGGHRARTPGMDGAQGLGSGTCGLG